MRVEFTQRGNTLQVIKEVNDLPYSNTGYAGGNAGESRLLYHVKNILNEAGFDLIKKRMWKDGHMVSEQQQYLRTRDQYSKAPHIYIYNTHWQVQGAEVNFNKHGVVALAVVHDVYGKQENCLDILLRYAKNLRKE